MNKISTYIIIKTACFFQAGIGILANAFLFVFHVFTVYQVHSLRPTDMTTCHLAFVHIVRLVTTPDIFSADTIKLLAFSKELKCKFLLYMSRVSRGLSISTTCLLSIVQVITISPSSFYLSRFKKKLKKYIIIAVFCFWSLTLSSNSNMIIYAVAHSNRTNLLNVNKYCSLASMNSFIMTLFFMLALSQNVFFIGILLLSSIYMVIFLCSHQRKSEYLHSMSMSPKISPVKRATYTVLVLVSFFVIMYCMDMTISSFSTVVWKYEAVLLYLQGLVVNVYATMSPLVLIISGKRIIDILQNMLAMITI